MNRREFLAKSGLALIALTSCKAPAPSGIAPRSSGQDIMVIDAHIHLYDTSRPQGVPYPDPANKLVYRPMLPADIEHVARPAGVKGAVFVECSPLVEDNQWVLDLVADEPFICAVVGNLNPEAGEFPALLERFARNPLFRGISIRSGRPINFGHPRLRPNLEALAAARCTLDVLIEGEDIVRMAQLAAELPGLRVMVDHFAHAPVTEKGPAPAWVRQMEHFTDLPNVYCKVSRYTEQAVIQPAPTETAYYAPTFEVLWRIFGADRFAYGSNWPPCILSGDYRTHVMLARDFFNAKGPGPLAKIMGRNAAVFYGGPRFSALTS